MYFTVFLHCGIKEYMQSYGWLNVIQIVNRVIYVFFCKYSQQTTTPSAEWAVWVQRGKPEVNIKDALKSK